MNLDLYKLEKIIKLKFKNQKLLKQSLTHKSYDSKDSNEKLEFIGDRVLGLVISKKLYEKYPNDKEGSLDKKLASLVNKKKCLEVANSISLKKFILAGNPKKSEYIEDKIVSDACESLIGAIYLDRGLDVATKFILNLWNKHIDLSEEAYIDPKTKLRELSLKNFKSLPIYKLVESSGPKHKPIFKVSVRLKNSKMVKGIGSSKKEAELNAAATLLKNFIKK